MDDSTIETAVSPWAVSLQRIAATLNTDIKNGLRMEEIRQRRIEYGPNKLKEVQQERPLTVFLRQFKSVIMVVLAGAAALSFVFKEWIDGTGILVAMFINAGIGFFTELQALRSMEALQKMDVTYSKVIRDGEATEIDAEELVPGDIVLVEGGDIVTADVRITEANRLQVDESALTGESVPIRKQTEPLQEDIPLAERSNMLHKGTAVTEGSGMGVVVSTGMDTELGEVASLVEEAEAKTDPLEKRLNTLAGTLVRIIVVVAIVTGILGIIAGKELFIMIETSVALFVAAIPEGLPIVATLALARGMHRMAKRNALVRRLSAVQTLGSTSVIFTDKTGTLTENRMTVTRYVLPDTDGNEGHSPDTAGSEEPAYTVHTTREMSVTGEGLESSGRFLFGAEEVSPSEDSALWSALAVGVMCNNAIYKPDEEIVGEPMEGALLVAGVKAGLNKEQLLSRMEEVREVAFDPSVKMMATFHSSEETLYVAVKGAPDAVLEHAAYYRKHDGETAELGEQQKELWREENERLAEEGLRVLALAERRTDTVQSDPYTELVFLGLVGLFDPPRDDVKEAIEVCHRAGVRVVMATGDQAKTAIAVGRKLGIINGESIVFHGRELEDLESMDANKRKKLLTGNIFYRVSPEQKLNLIALHQEANSIVAMTGDGVNDAPALKKADIGIAMGQRGEPVAEEASDILLQDDRFATINTAIEHGRTIYDNIRRFVLYMISGNVGEILIVMVATVAGAPLPLLPLQILYINAVNDIFPALALGVGPGSKEVMERPPRNASEPIVTRRHWYILGSYGLLIGGSVLLGFFLALSVFGWEVERAVTTSFLSIAFARLWHVFNMRDSRSRFFRNQITANGFVWGALALCTGLLVLAVYLSPLSTALDIVRPDTFGWVFILAISFLPFIVGQLIKGVVSVMAKNRDHDDA